MGVLQASSMGWNGAPALAGSPVVKKVVRLDVPVDKYPNVCVAFVNYSFIIFLNLLATSLMCYSLDGLVQLCWSFVGAPR